MQARTRPWRRLQLVSLASAPILGAVVLLFTYLLATGLLTFHLTPPLYYDVRDYGAKGDGLAKDTRALQAAIDAASVNGRGVVVLPPGKYLSGTIHLKSHVTLLMTHGSILIASADDADFDSYEMPPPGALSSARTTSWTFTNVISRPIGSTLRPDLLRRTIDNPDTTYAHYSLIFGDRISDVAIEGAGTIDGNRTTRGGPKLIAFKHCQHVRVQGLTLRNAPSYNISLIGTDDADLEGLRIVNGYADGIDPDNSRYVRITNCYIDTADDAICAKASLALGHRLATVGLIVSDCTLRTSRNAFKFGTESEGDFRDVTVNNCLMLRRDSGPVPISGVAIESVDGGTVDGVVISNVLMRDVRTPIFLRLGNRGRGMAVKRPGTMRNITISDIIATGAARAALLTGLPGFPITSVTLSNINVSEAGGARFAGLNVPELPEAYPDPEIFGELPAYSLYGRHVDRLMLSNLLARFERTDMRPAIVLEDIRGLEIHGVHADAVPGVKSVILHNVSTASPTDTGPSGE